MSTHPSKRRPLEITRRNWPDQYGTPQYVHTLTKHRMAAQIIATHLGVFFFGQNGTLDPDEARQLAGEINDAADEVMAIRNRLKDRPRGRAGKTPKREADSAASGS